MFVRLYFYTLRPPLQPLAAVLFSCKVTAAVKVTKGRLAKDTKAPARFQPLAVRLSISASLKR